MAAAAEDHCITALTHLDQEAYKLGSGSSQVIKPMVTKAYEMVIVAVLLTTIVAPQLGREHF